MVRYNVFSRKSRRRQTHHAPARLESLVEDLLLL